MDNSQWEAVGEFEFWEVYLIQGSDHVGRWVPCGSLGNGGARSQVIAGEDAALFDVTKASVNVLDGRMCQRTQTKDRERQKSVESDHDEEEKNKRTRRKYFEQDTRRRKLLKNSRGAAKC